MSRQIFLRFTLHAGGQRLTRQRRLILETLEASCGHLDAEDIHTRVRERDARVSLATVYRTLALLKSLGLVQEHSLGEAHSHFEIAQPEPHYHFTCLGCRRVIEFAAPTITRAVQRLAEDMDLHIQETHLSLHGYCAECQRKEASEHVA